MPRRYRQADIKILFAYSGNRCAFPECANPIVVDGTADDDAAVVGQIAHIVASSDDGPRGDPDFPPDARDHHGNLLLLCADHHRRVDAQDATYTVEELRRWKTQVVALSPEAETIILADAQRAIDNADEARDAANWADAVAEYDAAAELAKAGHAESLERRARFAAARARIHLITTSGPDPDQETLAAIADDLDVAEALGLRPVAVWATRAWLAAFRGEVGAAMNWGGRVLADADARIADRADVLIAQANALLDAGRVDDALALDGEMSAVLSQADTDVKWPLGLQRLRVLTAGGRIEAADVADFVAMVTRDVGATQAPRSDVVMKLSRAAAQLAEGGYLESAIVVSDAACTIARPLDDPEVEVGMAIQMADLLAHVCQLDRARRYLREATSASDRLRHGARSESTWPTLHAIVLFESGRILATHAYRTATGDQPEAALLEEAARLLTNARTFAVEHSSQLAGDTELYLADVCFWLGRVRFSMGDHQGAAALLAVVRSSSAMAHPRFWVDRGIEAWWLEIWAVRSSGDLLSASQLLDQLRETLERRPTDANGEISPKVAVWRDRSRQAREHLDRTDLAMLQWLESSPAAHEIAERVRTTSLHEAVAGQLAPLLSWWTGWDEGPESPRSELLDFWGRGGLARVAAAIRARPHAAIAVDARTIGEIRRWARILCPLFETVVVKWKGELGAGMVMAPMDVHYGGPGSFGGHGYMVSAGLQLREDWTVAMGWANPLPRAVTHFLASEALPLVASGRLVVLPAPSAGCTQTAVGWTDDLLVTGVLGGVVAAVGESTRPPATPPTGQRLLDLGAVALPFIDDVPLADLANVMEEMTPALEPLRRMVFGWLAAGDLQWERWEKIATVESEIREACTALDASLRDLHRRHGGADWHVETLTTTLSAGDRPGAPSERDPQTDRLHCVASGLLASSDVAPWIPYWRLSAAGGHLNWSCPLDNKGVLDEAGGDRGPTWLWPGTGGWTIPTVRPV